MHYKYAITRTPGANCAQGLTTAHLGTPDFNVLLSQHAAYVDTLRSLGVEVTVLDADPRFPDGYFVEDPAIVTPELAVLTNPGAAARQGEEEGLIDSLSAHRTVVRITAPGTLDGGDVLIIGKHVMVGLSERSNTAGVAQLREHLAEAGYTVDAVPVAAGLHFKSSVNHAGGNTIVVTGDFVQAQALQAYDHIRVDEEEEYAANTVWINDHLLTPAGYPRTLEKLAATGLGIIELDTSEIRKMDGGLTCLSLRIS